MTTQDHAATELLRLRKENEELKELLRQKDALIVELTKNTSHGSVNHCYNETLHRGDLVVITEQKRRNLVFPVGYVIEVRGTDNKNGLRVLFEDGLKEDQNSSQITYASSNAYGWTKLNSYITPSSRSLKEIDRRDICGRKAVTRCVDGIDRFYVYDYTNLLSGDKIAELTN